MKCEHCDIIDRKSKAEVIYEDNEVVIAIKDSVFTPGQMTIFPKEHLTILEQIPEKIIQKCALAANKVSIAAFESMGSQGTNIIINNGLGAGQTIPHFGVEIIPRQENDGLNFQWESKQLMEDELEMTSNLLKEEMDKFLKEEKSPQKKKDEVIVRDAETEAVLEKNKENYLLKSLRRIP